MRGMAHPAAEQDIRRSEPDECLCELVELRTSEHGSRATVRPIGCAHCACSAPGSRRFVTCFVMLLRLPPLRLPSRPAAQGFGGMGDDPPDAVDLLQVIGRRSPLVEFAIAFAHWCLEVRACSWMH